MRVLYGCLVGNVLYGFSSSLYFYVFFFNSPSTSDVYSLSLHDALPICSRAWRRGEARAAGRQARSPRQRPERDARLLAAGGDRKSTRLNSSHQIISYAVFCLKKKKNQ